MDDPARVRECQAARDLDRQTNGLAHGQRAVPVDALLERVAGQVLHDDVGEPVDLADVVDRHDVRVGELREGLGLADEQLAQALIAGGLRVQDLDGDVTVERLVAGEVDLGGSAHPERLQDAVALVEDAVHGELHPCLATDREAFGRAEHSTPRHADRSRKRPRHGLASPV